MKIKCAVRSLAWLLVGSILSPAFGASFNVNPSLITNDYTGLITLTATGLTNGEAVRITRHIDFNANGAPDGSDLLVQGFSVTDGQASVIDGITNLNVPRDNDGASNGQITTSFNFKNSAELSRGAGTYVFQFTSPTTNFSPSNVAFTVAQPPFSQMVTGLVKNATTSANLSNSLVAFLSTPNTDFVSAVGAGASAAYALKAAPGTYQVVAVRSNFIGDFSTLPVVTLNSGATINTNILLTPGTATLSGRIYDSLNTNDPVGGVQLFVESDSNQFTILFSDITNGTYTSAVTAGDWRLDISGASLAARGYLRPEGSLRPRTNITSGTVSNFNLALTKATALIYGSIKDTSDIPLPGIEFSASNGTNDSSGFSDTNGNYSVGAVAGNWFISPDNQNNPTLTNYLFQGTNVFVNDGQAVMVNFVARLATARLRGKVFDSMGAPVTNFQLNANGPNGYNPSSTTDASGNFDFPVVGGDWRIYPGNSDGDSAESRGLIFPDVSVTVVDGINKTNNIIARKVDSMIMGTVRNTFSNPVSGIPVYGSFTIGGTNYYVSVTTDFSGNYTNKVSSGGTWDLQLDCGVLAAQGYQCPNSVPVSVPGAGNYTQDFTVSSFPPLQITTMSLPDVTVGVPYNQTVMATNGQPGYNFSVVSGAPPPPLTLSTNGVLSGTPTIAGTFGFTVQVTDQSLATTNQPLSVTVFSKPSLGVTTPVSTNQFQFLLTGGLGQIYIVEHSQTFSNWTTLLTTNAPGSSFFITIPIGTNTRDFFRVRVGP